MPAGAVDSSPLHEALRVGVRDLLPLILQHAVDEVVGPRAWCLRPGSLEAAGVTMAHPEGVAAGDQCRSLCVVHGHAPEDLADLSAARHWIRVLATGCVVQGAFRIHVDETHSGCTQRLLAITLRLAAGR